MLSWRQGYAARSFAAWAPGEGGRKGNEQMRSKNMQEPTDLVLGVMISYMKGTKICTQSRLL